MGTNYYAVPAATEEEKAVLKKLCAKLPELHIGKSSHGWSFSFHSPYIWDCEELGIEHSIESFTDWCKVLGDSRWEIKDEYGDYVSYADFVNIVLEKREGKNHTTECLNSSREHERQHAREQCYLDPEGHSFSRGEFS